MALDRSTGVVIDVNYDKATAKDLLQEALYEVEDPELGINIVDLGLVYGFGLDIDESGTTVVVKMTLTSPACPLTDVLERDIYNVICCATPTPLAHDTRVHWVWSPPWDLSKVTSDGLDQLRSVGFNA